MMNTRHDARLTVSEMGNRWTGVVLVLLLTSGLIVSTGSAQTGSTDAAYARALTTIYGVARIGDFVKGWCDARAPQTKSVTAQGLVAVAQRRFVWMKSKRVSSRWSARSVPRSTPNSRSNARRCTRVWIRTARIPLRTARVSRRT
ncbi:MAG: hypothetical protein HC933_11020 [Pleurocapsa sp. SU_196_0]|nr:hypothetical protein [Pleurocapsa sp. SU_196_0]